MTWVLVWIVSGGVVPRTWTKAFEHVYDVMDRHHRTLDVCSDDGAAGNHLAMRGKMSDDGEVAVVEVHVVGIGTREEGRRERRDRWFVQVGPNLSRIPFCFANII